LSRHVEARGAYLIPYVFWNRLKGGGKLPK
jgi:hypothetical protein